MDKVLAQGSICSIPIADKLCDLFSMSISRIRHIEEVSFTDDTSGEQYRVSIFELRLIQTDARSSIHFKGACNVRKRSENSNDDIRDCSFSAIYNYSNKKGKVTIYSPPSLKK